MEHYLCLNDFLTVLTQRSGIHICVHDVSGILQRPDLQLEYKFRIHSKSFCDLAKSSRTGYEKCMRCKSLCNRRAVMDKKPFFGHCTFGLFEAVYPVVLENKTLAIVYVGGAVVDMDESKRRAEGSENRDLLYGELEGCPQSDSRELMKIAQAVDSYIRFILSSPPPEDNTSSNYPVSEIKARINSEYKKPLSLKGMAQLYFFNEKYLGRLFISDTGMTFHQYLNKIRTERAKSLLEISDLSILNIAFECGFDSVSYFNRVFKQAFGMTPSEYRKSNGVI